MKRISEKTWEVIGAIAVATIASFSAGYAIGKPAKGNDETEEVKEKKSFFKKKEKVEAVEA